MVKNKKSGFSLIELLVAVSILSIVGGMALIVLFTSIQSSNKTDITNEVKQNGDYAISVMEGMIRNSISQPSPCTGATSDTITISDPDGQNTTFKAQYDISTNRIASNSGFLTNYNVNISNLSFVCTSSSNTPATVSIDFNISQAATTTRPEEKASIPFHTMITLRTY